ncbi:MAG TPA: SDR family NAD(P)-dependent oxidoreductase [Bryobacteraceae bacterium]
MTGASRGIGAACAAAFRRRGCLLCLTGRDESALRRNSATEDLVMAGDIRDDEFRSRLVASAVERFGRIDILVNNAGAGIYWPPSGAPLNEVRGMFELNLFAPLSLSQVVLPHMRERNSGCIVNISSMGGEVMLPWISLYCASKFALSALTSALRSELAGTGIHAMTVCPGYVATDFKTNAVGPRPPAALMGPPSTGGSRFSVTPQQCAEAILRGIQRNARVVVTPRSGWLLIGAQRLFPGLVESRLTAFMKSLESEAAA